MSTIGKAFKQAPRIAFLPGRVKVYADADTPLPIGYEQTNSQPSTVRHMLEWLDVQPGNRVLDVGAGSGWTSALLSILAGPSGSVDATERIAELTLRAQASCESIGIATVSFHHTPDTLGWPRNAPYDRILVSASAPRVPPELIEQLATGGKMVLPVDSDVLEITIGSDHHPVVTTHPGYAFVPLVRTT